MLTAAPVIHCLYGIRIRTAWPVAGVPALRSGRWDVELLEGDSVMFAGLAAFVPQAQARAWAQSAVLPDGSSYCRWNGLLEFAVSADARRIHARALKDANSEAFLAYLLVQALSFSMIRLGREPLHATAVSAGRGAVAFLGRSGSGKSTLGAAFIRDGGRLLTDDMLVLTGDGDRLLVEPGPPRIKLYRDVATRIFGERCQGMPMNPWTEKLIIPLDDGRAGSQPTPLSALYLISDGRASGGRTRSVIRRLPAGRAFPRILAATAGLWPDEPDRLRRQFEFVTSLVRRTPVKTLSYPRNAGDVFRVRDAVLDDLSRSSS